jgi:hypothetical protein
MGRGRREKGEGLSLLGSRKQKRVHVINQAKYL